MTGQQPGQQPGQKPGQNTGARVVQTYKVKRVLGVLILLGSLLAVAGAIYLAGRVVVYSSTGANFANALNVTPQLPADLLRRVTWLPDAPGQPNQRALEPVVRQQITEAYLRAWGQLGLSYQMKRPYNLSTYFAGPLLLQVTEAVSATLASPGSVRQSSLSHAPQLTFYSDDGSVVAFTDHAARIVQQFTGKDPAGSRVVESDSIYSVVMVLEQGRWRVRAWRREGDAPAAAEAGAEAGARPAGGLSNVIKVEGSRFTLNGAPWTVRGANYYPSKTPWTLFWKNYDPKQTADDLAAARRLGLNTLRIFVPFTDFGGEDVDPAQIAKLQDFLNQAGANGIKVIVTLFDHRTDHAIENWGADDLHVAGVVAPFAWHPAVLAWDIKNEADRDDKLNTPALNQAWLRHIAATVREHDPNHLMTVGWSTPAAAAAAPQDFVDFVSFHYYGTEEAYPAQRAALEQAVGGKPLLLSEYGRSTWQWFTPADKAEQQQADYLRAIQAEEERQQSVGQSVGQVVWALFDFTTVPLPEFRWPWQQATQAHMGVLRSDGTEKAAVNGFR